MAVDDLDMQILSEVLSLVLARIPKSEEQFRILAMALLLVSGEDRSRAFSIGEFKKTQARQMSIIKTLEAVVGSDPDLESMDLKADLERAIEELNQPEIYRLTQEFRRRLDDLEEGKNKA